MKKMIFLIIFTAVCSCFNANAHDQRHKLTPDCRAQLAHFFGENYARPMHRMQDEIKKAQRYLKTEQFRIQKKRIELLYPESPTSAVQENFISALLLFSPYSDPQELVIALRNIMQNVYDLGDKKNWNKNPPPLTHRQLLFDGHFTRNLYSGGKIGIKLPDPLFNSPLKYIFIGHEVIHLFNHTKIQDHNDVLQFILLQNSQLGLDLKYTDETMAMTFEWVFLKQLPDEQVQLLKRKVLDEFNRYMTTFAENEEAILEAFVKGSFENIYQILKDKKETMIVENNLNHFLAILSALNLRLDDQSSLMAYLANQRKIRQYRRDQIFENNLNSEQQITSSVDDLKELKKYLLQQGTNLQIAE